MAIADLRSNAPLRFRAAIFDMDGVLVDSEPLHLQAINRILEREGHHLSEEENLRFIGTTLEFTWTELASRFGLTRPLDYYFDAYDRVILELLQQPLTPAPGSGELIADLRERGLRLALASSSRRSWIEAALKSLRLDGSFEVVVSGDCVSRSKPDPEIFLLAAQRLEVEPRRCLAIEDSPAGVLAARRAGMAVLAVRTPFTAHLAMHDADWVVDSLLTFDSRILYESYP